MLLPPPVSAAGAMMVSKAMVQVATNSNVNAQVRENAGLAQGYTDAKDIIANLEDGESIKIVTHSMGTAFARGYVEGIRKYAAERGITVNIESELDVNAFQGGDLAASAGVKTFNKTGGQDGGKVAPWFHGKKSVPTVAPVPNAINITQPEDADKGHDIGQMSDVGIPASGHNSSTTKKVEEGNNNANSGVKK